MAKKNKLATFIEKQKNRLLNSLLIKRILKYSKTNSMLGCEGVPIYYIVATIIENISKDNIKTRANSIAYSFFISLFPSLIVLFTLIPIFFPYMEKWILALLPNSSDLSFDEALLLQFTEILPVDMASQLNDYVQNILTHPRFDMLSVGFFTAIFFASNGMLNLMEGFEKDSSSNDVFLSRNGIMKRLVSIQLTAFVGLLIISSVLLIILGQSLIPWLLSLIEANGFQAFLFDLLRWAVILMLYYFAIGIMYRYAPNFQHKTNVITAGATVATSLSIVASIGFSYFVDNFSTYNQLYGVIGTIIALMIWLQINATVILIGHEINTSILVNKHLLTAKEEE